MTSHVDKLIADRSRSAADRRDRVEARLRKLERSMALRLKRIDELKVEYDDFAAEATDIVSKFPDLRAPIEEAGVDAGAFELVAAKMEAGEIRVVEFSDCPNELSANKAFWKTPIPDRPDLQASSQRLESAWPDTPEDVRRSLTIPGYLHMAYLYNVRWRDPALLDELAKNYGTEARSRLWASGLFCNRVFDLAVLRYSDEQISALVKREGLDRE